MSYPILTDIYRAQVVHQGPSGLPEDQWVNNFYFRNDSVGASQESVANTIATVLDAFYDQVNGTATSTVASRLQTGLGAVYKVYDLGFAPPRFPVVDPIAASWTGAQTTNLLPREVACCLSFRGGPGPRQRGRVYIGPLAQNAIAQVSGVARPASSFELILMESARNVINTTENVTWVVASPTGATTTVVTDGWVDDAFDTQRSRGAAPSKKRRFDASGIDV